MNLKKSILNWRAKGLIQASLSVLPGGGRVNDYLQKSVGGLKKFECNINDKVGDWGCMMAYLGAVQRGDVEGRRILEIGTGWYPTLPMCLALAGAQRVYTVDLQRHLDSALTFRMLA